MTTICNKCGKTYNHRNPGYSCPYCYEGIGLDICSYVDWTNDIIKLYRHSKSLTIFVENGFVDTEFPLNACRVVSRDYIEENPKFVPCIPLRFENLPKKAKQDFLKLIRRKIKLTKLQYNFYFDKKTTVEDIKRVMFLH